MKNKALVAFCIAIMGGGLNACVMMKSSQYNALKKDYERYKTEDSICQQERERLQNETEALLLENATLKAQVEQLKQDTATLKEENKRYSNSIDQSLTDYNKVNKTYKELQENSRKEAALIVELKQKINSLNEEIGELNEIVMDKDEDIIFLKEKLAEAERQIDDE